MIKTFIVPGLDGEDMVAYQFRVSSMAWQFTDEKELSIPVIGEVTLDGEKPAGSDFAEKV